MYNIIISCFSLHRIAFLRNTDAVSVLRENGFLEVYAIKKLIKKICSGFSVPTLIYESSRLSFRLKILIHLTAGALIYLITAHFSGWIKARPDAAALFLLISLTVAAFPALHAFLSAKRRTK